MIPEFILYVRAAQRRRIRLRGFFAAAALFTALSTLHAQSVIDKQNLKPAKTISLMVKSDSGGNHFWLRFVDRLKKDSSDVPINDSLQSACENFNGIFFIDDSTGFLTASGVCYAFYNTVFRTADRGKTWTKVYDRLDGSAVNGVSPKTFFMFNSKRGIIVRDADGGKISVALTYDGGRTWKDKSIAVANLPATGSFEQAFFSNDGTVMVIVGNTMTYRNDREIITLQSTDFGETFKLTK